MKRCVGKMRHSAADSNYKHMFNMLEISKESNNLSNKKIYCYLVVIEPALVIASLESPIMASFVATTL